MKYHITTFGCQMNVHESEKLAGILEKLGYSFTDNLNDADVIVFNTCAIREGAENRAIGNIGALKQLKKDNPNKIIVVCGCMTQQREVSEKLYKTFPFIDIIFGTKNFEKFENYLLNLKSDFKDSLKLVNKKPRILEIEDKDNIVEDLPMARSSGNNYWVNIIFGCNNFCTYCIVPYVRGRERSRDREEILKEIKEIISKNSNNENKIRITLLGQNVNSYGQDKYKDYGFAELLEEISKLEGNFELAFMTSHPKDITDKVIEIIANEKNIVKELHLPIQSGSNEILKLMNRKYTVEDYLKKVEKLKSLIPNIRLTTDIIVGFPGETEEDFNKSCELIKNVKYAGIFAFMYSPRTGTAAAKMKEQVPLKIKNERVNKILALQKKVNN
ncbi:MAG: tRNA (N6-isopentenyl adenosine(37)-C2)-methylthiotransferase MiaB [Clostridia bacterium]|nr:tRNA (N6-isopentenyl adenosine(37)-C2)-methylthiotransferase MiaB [Clostridia bacterium]